MNTNNETPTEQVKWGPAEVMSVTLFVLSVAAWLFGFPMVSQCMVVLTEPKLGDAAIGGFFVALVTLAVGMVQLTLATILAATATGLPSSFRVFSLLPGLLAVVLAIIMIAFACT